MVCPMVCTPRSVFSIEVKVVEATNKLFKQIDTISPCVCVCVYCNSSQMMSQRVKNKTDFFLLKGFFIERFWGAGKKENKSADVI